MGNFMEPSSIRFSLWNLNIFNVVFMWKLFINNEVESKNHFQALKTYMIDHMYGVKDTFVN